MDDLVKALLALAEEATAAGLAGGAGIRLTVTGISRRHGADSLTSAAAQHRAFEREDRVRAEAGEDPLFGARASFHGRAAALLEAEDARRVIGDDVPRKPGPLWQRVLAARLE